MIRRIKSNRNRYKTLRTLKIKVRIKYVINYFLLEQNTTQLFKNLIFFSPSLRKALVFTWPVALSKAYVLKENC